MAISKSNAIVDRSFAKKLRKIGGMEIFKCIQCGMCSAVCPMVNHMDILPRRIIHMCRLRMQEQVMASKTPWICATCFECKVRCPRGVDIPTVMESIRLLTQRKNINCVEPYGIPLQALKEFPQIALVACFRKHTA